MRVIFNIALSLIGWIIASSTPPLVHGQNIAFGKSATQIGDYWHLYVHECAADLAIDGNIDPEIYHLSVSVTANKPNAWWELDLGAEYNISSILLFNRDVFGSRLNRFNLTLDKEDGSTIFSYQAPPGDDNNKVYEVDLSPIGDIGSKIKIVNTQSDERNHFLQLAEVMVFGDQENLALSRPATQSSTFKNQDEFKAGNANDGIFISPRPNSGTSVTQTGGFQWWDVQLDGPSTITQVIIFNRPNELHMSSIDGAIVRIRNSPPSNDAPGDLSDVVWSSNALVANVDDPPMSFVINIPAGKVGNHISVDINLFNSNTRSLNMLEVMVFGEAAKSPPSLSVSSNLRAVAA